MAEHTHVLARPHTVVREGERIALETGARVTPTPEQLQNMPDVFIANDVASAAADETHGLRAMSVGSVKDAVTEVNDLATLKEMFAEEESGRNRVGALAAIGARGEVLSAELEEDDEGGAEE